MGKGKKAKATATVSVPGLTAPGGTVQFMEGSKVLVKGTLSNGKVTVTLPVLKPGSHKIVVKYLGTSATAPVARRPPRR